MRRTSRGLGRVASLVFGVAVFAAACGGDDEPAAGSTQGQTGSAGGPSGTVVPGGTSLGDVKKGIATFYDANGTGNCGFDASPKDLDVVALNKAKYWENSALCGGCLRVTGAKGSVVVRAVDSCPVDTPDNDCGDTGADLDLSASAFAKIDEPKKGKVEVTFELVACETQGPMSYRFKEGSSQYWTAIQVRNHHVPVSKLEYLRDGTWTDVPRVDYNYFIAQKGMGPQPNGVSLRITSRDGQVVEEKLPRIEDGKVVQGTKQFE